MEPEDDATFQAVLAHAGTIPLESVEAELSAAMADPLLQDVVERAVAEHAPSLTAEQREDAQMALLAYLATDVRTQRLLEEIRSGGGKSHVVDSGGAREGEVAVEAGGAGPRRSRGRR
jgi:hypothetical protein